MIHLYKDYYLETDKYNYILVKKWIVQDKTSKSYGKEAKKNIAFFGKLEWLYRYLVELEIKEDITILKNLEKVINKVNEIAKGIKGDKTNG